MFTSPMSPLHGQAISSTPTKPTRVPPTERPFSGSSRRNSQAVTKVNSGMAPLNMPATLERSSTVPLAKAT